MFPRARSTGVTRPSSKATRVSPEATASATTLLTIVVRWLRGLRSGRGPVASVAGAVCCAGCQQLLQIELLEMGDLFR